MMPRVKLESEAEETTWQRFCSEMDIMLIGQEEEDSRQAGEAGRPELSEGSEAEGWRWGAYNKLVVGNMRIARCLKESA